MASGFEKYDKAEDDGSSESEDQYTGASPAQRTSDDVRRHDQDTLGAEEEAERLLGGQEEKREPASGTRLAKIFARSDGEDRPARREKRRTRRRARKEEKRELMYEMEEGGPRSSSAESSEHSSEVDMARLGEMQARSKKVRTI